MFPESVQNVLRYCDQETLLLLLVLVYLRLSFCFCVVQREMWFKPSNVHCEDISKTNGFRCVHAYWKFCQQPLITLLIAGACVRGVVDLDTSPAGVAIAPPILPGNPPDDRTSRRLGRIITLKYLPYVIRLLRVGSVDRPSFRTIRKGNIGDNRLGVVLYAIDPAIADSIAELLLLAPEDGPWQVRLRVGSRFHIESLAQYVLE